MHCVELPNVYVISMTRSIMINTRYFGYDEDIMRQHLKISFRSTVYYIENTQSTFFIFGAIRKKNWKYLFISFAVLSVCK
jgi:hypothetical protein